MEAPSNFDIVNNPKITTQFHKSQNPKRFMVWAFDDDIPCKILKKTQSGLSMCKGIELRIKDIWFPHILPKDSPNTIGYQSEALCSASRYLNWKGLRWPTIYLYQFEGSNLELISNKQQKKTRGKTLGSESSLCECVAPRLDLTWPYMYITSHSGYRFFSTVPYG